MTNTTFFAGRRWVPAHRGAWYVERSDTVGAGDAREVESAAGIQAGGDLAEETGPSADPIEDPSK